MVRNPKVMAALVGAVVLTAASVGYAAPQLAGARPAGSTATAPPAVPQVNGSNITTQIELVPITPCRILDTRSSTAGILAANAQRSVIVAGKTGFPAQGGTSGGCGIPAGAAAIAASLSATGVTGTGYIHAWPSALAEPNATVVNYNATAGSVSTGQTLAITPDVSAGLLVKAIGAPTHFVIDVLGYYREPIAGLVNGNGTFGTHSTQALTAARNPGNASGVYVVTFDHFVEGCILVTVAATTASITSSGYLSGTTATLIARVSSSGALTDAPVAFTVTC